MFVGGADVRKNLAFIEGFWPVPLGLFLAPAGFPAWPGPSASLAAHLIAPGGTSPLLPVWG